MTETVFYTKLPNDNNMYVEKRDHRFELVSLDKILLRIKTLSDKLGMLYVYNIQYSFFLIKKL